MQSAPSEYRARFDLGFSQPMVCANFPYADQCYGVFSTYGSQIMGRVMLPLNLATDDGPIYVNANQYHGIMRRQQCRAKAEMENKAARLRKPYMHKSCHLHAMRRPRGCGGIFLIGWHLFHVLTRHEVPQLGRHAKCFVCSCELWDGIS